MKPIILAFFNLLLISWINADSSEDNNYSKDNLHFEILFDGDTPKKSFYLNLETRSLWSTDFESKTMLLVNGLKGRGLVIDMKNLKAWVLIQHWRVYNNNKDVIMSARRVLTKVKSFEEYVQNKNRPIDLINWSKDYDQIKWTIENIVVNILGTKGWIPTLFELINLENLALESLDYFNIYSNQKNKGVKVTMPLNEILIANSLLKPLLSGTKVQKEKLVQININWEKIYGYKGPYFGANLNLVYEVVKNLKKEVKSCQRDFLADITKLSSKIVKVTGNNGGNGCNGDEDHDSNESE